MKVLVSDTSVLVDLERGSFLETSFRLPYEFAVPDLLYERELKDYGGDKLVELGLRIEELDGDGVASAIAYRHQHPSLSLPDCFALALARANSWILLTGDGGLRGLANDERVDCHGVLWLIDQIQEAAVAAVQELNAGLEAIGDHPRCRLPRTEIRRRLALYAKILSEGNSRASRSDASSYRSLNPASTPQIRPTGFLKHFNFLLCDKGDLSIVCAIELDDKSHEDC